MNSVLKREDNATELRLDYDDISAGPLVIVIHGLPNGTDRPAPSAVSPEGTSPSGSNGRMRRIAPSTPLAGEARAINDVAGYAPALVSSLVLAAWRGQEARATELIGATTEYAEAEDESLAAALAGHARAILCNGLGRYGDACTAAELACAHDALHDCPWALVELVEAAARSHARGVATEALSRLDDDACASVTGSALGFRARSAALLSDGEQAEGLFLQAIELLGGSGVSPHLARAQLVYGEWLRRERRRVDARVQLRAAHENFSRLGAEAFAGRALRELLATGETARKRTDDTRGALTPQEAEIARMAQNGLSNPEIGAELFLSPRTVQYHLRKVFRKLDIHSRNQLGRVPLERLPA